MASGLTIEDVLNGVLGDSDDESGNEFSDDELEYGEDLEEDEEQNINDIGNMDEIVELESSDDVGNSKKKKEDKKLKWRKIEKGTVKIY